jgi:four helix bundle protein
VLNKPHKRLDVWKKAIDLVQEIYDLTKIFPKNEDYSLTNQMRRAAISVPSNISEGAARQTKKEFIQFLHIAQGSRSELVTQMEIAIRLGYLKEDRFSKVSLVTKIFAVCPVACHGDECMPYPEGYKGDGKAPLST